MYKKILFLFCLLTTVICNAQYVETASNGLYYDPTSGTAARVVGLGGALIQNTSIDLGSSYNLYFKKGAVNYLSIANNGHVVINDVSGEEKLTIFDGNILMKGPGGLNTAMGALKFSYYYTPAAWAGISGITNSGGVDQLDLAFYTAYGSSSEKMRIMSQTGFVGIGTSTPQTNLDINGTPWGVDWVSLQATGRIRVKSNSNPGLWLNNGTNDKGFIGYVTDFPDHAIGFYTATSGWAMHLLQNGNFGIGTTAPTQKLDVNGNIYTSGKVLIGATDAGQYANYALAVNGNAVFNKVKVKLYGNWPDYVFEEGYQLPSLKELSAFIKQHKHLPGLPQASEVEKNGIDVGDNAALLLKKIEELTLYMIDLNKREEALSQKVDELNKENKELREKLQPRNK